jgi:CheY-like chemotaxis protein
MKKISCTLLIDDDEATNFINEMLIEDLGFTNELLVARNGLEALALIKERCKVRPGEGSPGMPDLILLDINMPVMDGFGFLKVFNELDLPEKQKTKVVMLTTSVNPNDVSKIKELGIDTVLNKPLTEAELIALLE